VRRVLRRSSIILLSLAAITTGCSTFSDSNAVARVNGVELTQDQFDAQLEKLGVTGTDVVNLDPVRSEIGRWINSQLVSGDDLAALYDQGAAASGVVCVEAIVVTDQPAADAAVAQLQGGTEFTQVFQTANLDTSLTSTNGAIPCIGATDLATNAGTPFIDAAAKLTADDEITSAPILDTAGAETAWVVLRFRPYAELGDADAQSVAGLIDVSGASADADIYVDSRYGTFDRATGTVVSLG
jgi:hypothetical protein